MPASKKREKRVWIVEVCVAGEWTPILRDGELIAFSTKQRASVSASAHEVVRLGAHRAAEYRRVRPPRTPKEPR